MSDITPFKGRIINPSAPMRVLHRSKKPGHWAEIRERKVTTFRAIEYIVFMDGSLLNSMLFHNEREVDYPKELAARIKQSLMVVGLKNPSTYRRGREGRLRWLVPCNLRRLVNWSSSEDRTLVSLGNIKHLRGRRAALTALH